MNIKPTKLAQLDTLTLDKNSHPAFDEGHCAMEIVAWLADEEHTDRPSCTCPVIAAFVRRLNDGISSTETRTRVLRPVLPLLLGTTSRPDVEHRRAWMATDWAIRFVTPKYLRLTPSLVSFAEQLEGLPEVDRDSVAKEARAILIEARRAAVVVVAAATSAAATSAAAYAAAATSAAAYAAYAAATSAAATSAAAYAADATYAAAYAAAYAAYAASASPAAYAAAAYAAYAAATTDASVYVAAAYAAYAAATTDASVYVADEEVYVSAQDLLRRMCEVN